MSAVEGAVQAVDVTTDHPENGWWSSWWTAAVLGVLAAVPTIAYGVRGGGLITDDWKILGEIAYGGLDAKVLTRPIGYGWYGIEYWLFGQSVWPHLLLLAVANAGVAVLLYRLLLRYVPYELALVAGVVWLVLPNRSSTRFWATATPIVASLAMVLLASLMRSAPRPWLSHQRLWLSLLLAAAVLAYEGALGLVIGVIVWDVWKESTLADRARTAMAVGVLPALATIWVFVNAPRREGFEAFTTIDRLPSVLVGDALLPDGIAGFGPLLLVPVGWAAATLILPSFKTRFEERLVLIGVVVIGLGVLPFIAAGFPFSTTGLNDRGAYFASVGLTLVIAGTIGMAARLARPLAVAGLVLVVVLCAPGAWSDMDDYLVAISDGQRLATALVTLGPEVDLTEESVLATLPNNGGVQFLNTSAELRRFIAVTDESLTVSDLDDLHLDELHRPLSYYRGTILELVDDRLVVVGHNE